MECRSIRRIMRTHFDEIRLQVPAIRCEGIRLLAKLQDPRDPGCVYMNKILFHMGKDPKAEVSYSLHVLRKLILRMMKEMLDTNNDERNS